MLLKETSYIQDALIYMEVSINHWSNEIHRQVMPSMIYIYNLNLPWTWFLTIDSEYDQNISKPVIRIYALTCNGKNASDTRWGKTHEVMQAVCYGSVEVPHLKVGKNILSPT